MPADIPKYARRPHSFERLAHPVQRIAGARRAPPFCMLCFLCRDSLRGQSLMNLDCRFVVVWPQRQTFVRILLQLQNRTSASNRRPTPPPQYYPRRWFGLTLTPAPGHQVSLFTRYCFTIKPYRGSQSSFYCPPLPAKHTLLQYYCTINAQYMTPTRPLL